MIHQLFHLGADVVKAIARAVQLGLITPVNKEIPQSMTKFKYIFSIYDTNNSINIYTPSDAEPPKKLDRFVKEFSFEEREVEMPGVVHIGSLLKENPLDMFFLRPLRDTRYTPRQWDNQNYFYLTILNGSAEEYCKAILANKYYTSESRGKNHESPILESHRYIADEEVETRELFNKMKAEIRELGEYNFLYKWSNRITDFNPEMLQTKI